MNTVTYCSIQNFVDNYQQCDFFTVSRFFTKKAQNDQRLINLYNGNNTNFCIDPTLDKTVFLFSGSIAAGKSTVAYSFIKYFDLNNLPYVSSDYFYKAFFSSNNFEIDYNKSRKYTLRLLHELYEYGNSFIWETVFSKDEKKIFLQELKNDGYSIVTFYISIDDYKTAISRSKDRALGDYHNVNSDFIIDRYNKTINSIEFLRNISDVFVVLDNSVKLNVLYYCDKNTNYNP